MQPNSISKSENKKSCIAYLVFRDNEYYKRFLFHFDSFISHMPHQMRIEKLLCVSLMTCELRIEGVGNSQTFRENIVEAYNQTLYAGFNGMKMEESFDHFWSHPDFIIHTVDINEKKNFSYTRGYSEKLVRTCK